MATRRTKSDYEKLYKEGNNLFEGCDVVLFPNGRPEMWVRSRTNPNMGFKIEVSNGPVGMSLKVDSLSGAPDITVHTQSTTTQAHHASLTQYKPDEYSQRFRLWYENPEKNPNPEELGLKPPR